MNFLTNYVPICLTTTDIVADCDVDMASYLVTCRHIHTIGFCLTPYTNSNLSFLLVSIHPIQIGE